MTADPATAVRAAAGRRAGCPRRSRSSDVERLLEAARVGDTPASLRDRALLEVLYGAGRADLRGGRPRRRRRRPRRGGRTGVGPAARQGRQGADRAAGPVRGRRPSTPTSSARARSCATTGRGTPGPVPQPARWPGCRGRAPGACCRPAAERADLGGPRLAAHAAALVRHAPARRGRRRAGRAGAARPRLGDDDADLHAGHGRSGCERSMPGLTRGRADRVRERDQREVLSFRLGEAPVTAEANPQVSTYPTAEPHPREDPLPGTEKAGVGALGPTGRPLPDFPEPRAADQPRTGPHHRHVQPEGRRRQDHDDDQPRRRAGRGRPQGAARRLRPAGRPVGGPGRSAPTSST